MTPPNLISWVNRMFEKCVTAVSAQPVDLTDLSEAITFDLR